MLTKKGHGWEQFIGHLQKTAMVFQRLIFHAFYRIRRARSHALQDKTRQILIIGQLLELGMHIFGVDENGFALPFVGGEGDLVEQFFHDGMQTPGANIFGGYVDMSGHFGDGANGFAGEGEINFFGSQQGAILTSQGIFRFVEDAYKLFDSQTF